MAEWKDVRADFSSSNQAFSNATRTMSAAGDIFSKLGSQIAQRKSDKDMLAFRNRALEMQMDQDEAKLNQAQAQFEAELGLQQENQAWERDYKTQDLAQRAYADDQANSTVRQDFNSWLQENPQYMGNMNAYGPSGAAAVGGYNGLGSSVRRFESGNNGINAINPNDNGHGPSLGSYQLNGDSINNFGRFIGGEAGNALVNAGNKIATWQSLVNSGAITPEQETAFIKKSHYDPAFNALSPEMQKRVSASPALQEALWSAAIQHGPGNGSGNRGASAIFNAAQGADDNSLLNSIYSTRANWYGGTPGVRERMAEELGVVQGLVGMTPQSNGRASGSSLEASTAAGAIGGSSAASDALITDLVRQRDALYRDASSANLSADQAADLTNRARAIDAQIVASTAPVTPGAGMSLLEQEALMAPSNGSGEAVATQAKGLLDQFNETDYQSLYRNIDNDIAQSYLQSQGVTDQSQLTANGAKELQSLVKSQGDTRRTQFMEDWENGYAQNFSLEGLPMNEDAWNRFKTKGSQLYGEKFKPEKTAMFGLYEGWKSAEDAKSKSRADLEDQTTMLQERFKEEDKGVLGSRNRGMATSLQNLAGDKSYYKAVEGALSKSILQSMRDQDPMAFGNIETAGFSGDSALLEDSFAGFNDAIDTARDVLKSIKPNEISRQAFYKGGNDQSGQILENAWKEMRDAGLVSQTQMSLYDQNTAANDAAAEKRKQDATVQVDQKAQDAIARRRQAIVDRLTNGTSGPSTSVLGL